MQINLWSIESIAAIIIEDENSPVTYSNQANGLACDHPETKGYLVPVEFRGRILVKFMSGCIGGGWGYYDSFDDDIPQIMKQLNDYFCNDYTFELDESKLEKNTESWVHLVAKRGKQEQRHHGILRAFPDTFTAILTWPNSD